MKKVLVLSVVLMVTTVLNASSWDFVAEYGHPTQSAPWSYGWSPNGDLSFFGLLNVADIVDGHAAWWKDTSGNPPVMWRNDNATVDYGIQPGEVALHTSWTNWDMIKVRWTAPATLTQPDVNLVGTWGAGDSGEVEVWIVKNAGLADQATLFHMGSTYDAVPFDLSVAVMPNDTIDFVQGVGTAMLEENTPLQLVITEVPEPMTIAMLSLVRQRYFCSRFL